jgi:hypothetical protein
MLIPSIGLIGTPSSFIFSSAVPSYVRTGKNELRPLPSSFSTNGMVDHRWLICPHPPSPILPDGCNTSGCSLPPALLTGCLTIFKNSSPQPMLFVPFATRNGSNKQFAKNNRPPACCFQNCPRGPFFLGLAPTRNAPTRIGSGWSTNCGSTSATASRQQPANAFKQQEAAHCQCLLKENSANKCQEAAHKEAAPCQHLVDKEAAYCLMA